MDFFRKSGCFQVYFLRIVNFPSKNKLNFLVLVIFSGKTTQKKSLKFNHSGSKGLFEEERPSPNQTTLDFKKEHQPKHGLCSRNNPEKISSSKTKHLSRREKNIFSE